LKERKSVRQHPDEEIGRRAVSSTRNVYLRIRSGVRQYDFAVAQEFERGYSCARNVPVENGLS